jgi:hypothetical protein
MSEGIQRLEGRVPDKPRVGVAGLLTLHRRYHVRIGVTDW